MQIFIKVEVNKNEVYMYKKRILIFEEKKLINAKNLSIHLPT